MDRINRHNQRRGVKATEGVPNSRKRETHKEAYEYL